MSDYATAKRELWARIQAEAPALADDMRALKDFGYQVLHVELGGEVVWHIEEPELRRMPGAEWVEMGREIRGELDG